jgi:hypothetical protein
MAWLIAKNGRIMFSPALASDHADRRKRKRFAVTRRMRAATAHLLERLQRCPPPLRLCHPGRADGAQRPVQRAGTEAAAPFQRVVAASIGKSAN